MIRVDDLWKSFDGRPVLRGASFRVERGETFAIIGKSGSGKSVLLKHIVGLMAPDRGRVAVGDADLTALSKADLKALRRRFGVLFQGGALFDSMTALENVAFPLTMAEGTPEREARQRAAACLEMVELGGAAMQRPDALSGGQTKRVALARAIAPEPEYLFCDEPNSGLDPETAAQTDALIQRLTRELGVTTVVVTHDMRSVLTIAGRAGFLGEGRMRFVGTTEEMQRSTDPALARFLRTGAYQVDSGPSGARVNGIPSSFREPIPREA
jgi:phospholipid/cholesterol/gamma-HCH transport system ATP-binding protein